LHRSFASAETLNMIRLFDVDQGERRRDGAEKGMTQGDMS
jgi:hypothetical protein